MKTKLKRSDLGFIVSISSNYITSPRIQRDRCQPKQQNFKKVMAKFWGAKTAGYPCVVLSEMKSKRPIINCCLIANLFDKSCLRECAASFDMHSIITEFSSFLSLRTSGFSIWNDFPAGTTKSPPWKSGLASTTVISEKLRISAANLA